MKIYKSVAKGVLNAFTLAEVLITLGIIGVIAAMTLPTLISNINDIRFRSQFFKSYSLIQQTLKRMEADDVAIIPGQVLKGNNERFINTFKNYFTNAVDCGDCSNLKLGNGCYDFNGSSRYLSLDGKKNIDNFLFDDGQLLMPDGSLFMFENPVNGQHNEGSRLWIWIDVNSASKPPNRLGYDVFCFQITDDGLLKPMGQDGTTYVDNDGSKYCNKNGSGGVNGISCANKLIQNPQDYYKWLRRKGD